MSGTVEQLQAQIKVQGDAIRQLKAAQAPADDVQAALTLMQDLKERLRIETGAPPADAKKLVLKTPKGTRDYTAKEMSVRSDIFQAITSVFERHGAVTIDTPVFELKEILMGKYGEDSKLIYDLADQGGESCSLRYDLTVPFARYVAMNGVTSIKRYHIAKVYRRDQPAMTKGRMREFFQCDYDIAGAYDVMVADAECVRVAVEVLSKVDVGAFVIKINHRMLLDAVFETAGVEEEKVRAISSAVDKLDKLPWADVRREMTEEKGLDGAVADRIGEFVQLRGGAELLERLQSMPDLMRSEKAQQGVREMQAFFKYAEIYGVLDRISFDMSLARGLDYYTGIIYEAVLVEEEKSRTKSQTKSRNPSDESQARVGSIAAGGRYDKLVGMFAESRGKKAADVPCVGISFGVERIYSVVMSRMREQQIKANRTQVYVIAAHNGLLEERMRITTELWDAGIAAEFMYKAKAKLQAQFKVCDDERIPLAVIIGQSEIDDGIVLIKNMAVRDESQGNGVRVKRVDMVAELKQRLGQ
ncbi:Cytoplasmic and mitochondrial histidine tRNA synthetase [Coemansia sp. RSA 2523]|nr:Cytoplasmic and mitochondrial histidine tRNA synthetase [Coemansia sp. RSA 2523]KAJ2278680.1 Cytoplasmic and mitochondrial histidine tRNA synthetase [Coemansia sp. RSA 451]KAJ2534218.1 Cytoplasmic and mitochondrial histidine tRNA synthetase [Coemansia sp. RSA 1937]KAJ2578098.1 Cytoplasmic and mitochondrial histidine tRNA synthetase [Coemansia sp. RSA 1807]